VRDIIIIIITMQDESESPLSSLPICLDMSGSRNRILPPECSCHILAFLTVRDIVNMAATSQQSLAASLPILRRIHGSLFFGNDDDDHDHDYSTAPETELRDCCSFVGHEEDTEEQGKGADGPGQQEEDQDQQPQPRHPTTRSLRKKEERRPSFTTLHERIQMLADLIPSKYSNRANIQALRAALFSAAAAARQRRPDSSASASSCGARIQELQSLMLPLRLWHEITRIPSTAVTTSTTTTTSNHHHRADDDAAATTTGSNSCLLDEYLGDVYCVLYLSWPSSQRRQQLHRIIIGNSRRPTPSFFGNRVSTNNHNNNNHHNNSGGTRGNDQGGAGAGGGGVRYGDWVYWHARWLTTPGLLTNEQRTRFGVMILPEQQHCPQNNCRPHHNQSLPSVWPPTTPLAAAASSVSLSSSFLTLVYDDFAPLGPQFRGRDIVRMLDVSASYGSFFGHVTIVAVVIGGGFFGGRTRMDRSGTRTSHLAPTPDGSTTRSAFWWIEEENDCVAK
jgi:hypothetical protein